MINKIFPQYKLKINITQRTIKLLKQDYLRNLKYVIINNTLKKKFITNKNKK